MNRRNFLKVSAAASSYLFIKKPLLQAKQYSEFPNILYILADDMGVGDVSYYNKLDNAIKTPNLDNLAKKGVVFTDAHSGASVCTPTRYGLLTGRYCFRSELKSEAVRKIFKN